MNSPADHSKQPDDDSQSTPWWNPFHWPAGIWVLIVALLLMSTPFAIRTVMLMGVPSIPEPFDIAEFSKWEIPASKDAFTDYRKATDLHQQLISDMQTQRIADVREPDDYMTLLETGWAEATEPTKQWLELHHDALVHWKRGTEKTHGLNESPAKLTFSSMLSVVQDQRVFVRLAMLEEARAISAGQFDEAREWARAAFRCGGHTSHRGPLIQGMVGAAVHAVSSGGLVQWAQQPEVTSSQLQQALADVRSDYLLYESPSNLWKTEYLSMRNTFQSPTWVETIAPVNPSSANSIATTKTVRLCYWVIGEPELTLRISRQILANQLPEIDKPRPERRKLVGAGLTMLFDPDPTVPRTPGQMDPATIDQAIKRSSLTRMLLSATRSVDDALQRQSARQAVLEALLALQAYRRDHGEFPESLSQLVPHYLNSVPLDPCDPSSGPLLYRCDEPTKASVWSVGLDQIDGDGAFDTPTSKASDVGYVAK